MSHISKTAEAEIIQLESEGYTLTPEQIVRINDAGRELERIRGDASPCSAPRTITCGGLLFHEPTLQSSLWLDEIRTDFYAECGDDEYAVIALHGFALHHATEPGFFDRSDMGNIRTVKEAVRLFRKSVTASMSRLSEALGWLYVGEDDETEDEKDLDKKDLDKYADPDAHGNTLYSALAEAVAIGLSADEVKRMTSPVLHHILERAWRARCGSFRKSDLSGCGRFYRTVRKIREELANGSKGQH